MPNLLFNLRCFESYEHKFTNWANPWIFDIRIAQELSERLAPCKWRRRSWLQR
uniref:Uncharacterized protein n=1 Tax=Arundo donax TaxID=35708 RepID=A0A0A9H365_ARUDO